MGQVTVSINGRQYRIGCEDGEEHRLLQLGGELEQRTADLREKFGEIGDARLSIMAALMLLDELAEARGRIAAAQQEIAAVRQARDADAQRLRDLEDTVAATLDAAAARIAKLSRQLSAGSDAGTPVAMG